LLIQHSNYSAILYTPTDCFFGDSAHWAGLNLVHCQLNVLKYHSSGDMSLSSESRFNTPLWYNQSV